MAEDWMRLSHVIRIFGTNANEEVLHDIFLDVERVDVFRSTEQSKDGHWQGTYRRLHWNDDVDNALEGDGQGNPSRLRGQLRICSPDEEDPENPEEWVPVAINIQMKFKHNDEEGAGVTSVVRGYRNSADNLVRRVEARRIFFRETTIDDQAQAAIDNDPERKAFVIAADQYDFVEDTEDKDNYLEVQYMSVTEDMVTEETTGAGQKDQAVVLNLRNKQYLNITDEAEDDPNPVHGFDPPWALDPFQNIVNVQFKPPEEILVATSLKNHESQTTEDGRIYEEGFGEVSTAATGLGKTIASIQGNIVFGKPSGEDASSCFIMIDGSDGFASIQRGVTNEQGEIVWSVVKTINDASGAVSVSFAGGAFFVSANDGDSESYLYVSFDGETWSKRTIAVNPNGGEDGENGSPSGNNVAYNPDTEIYCHTGNFTRAYQYDLIDIDDDRHHTTHAASTNFWSAVSSDGLNWTPKYNKSNFYAGSAGPPTNTGNQGAPGDCTNSVAYGAGLFVVPSSWAIAYDYFNFAGELNVLQHVINRIDVCGFATSRDGVSWTNQQLPGTEWDPGIFVFDPHGDGSRNRTALQGLTSGIIWCRTGGVDPETKKPKGFFLISGFEFANGNNAKLNIRHKKRWISSNGRDWERTLSLNDQELEDDGALSVHKKNADPEKVIKI